MTSFVVSLAGAALLAAAPAAPDQRGDAPPKPVPPARVFVSPFGDDAGPCTRAVPCASFDRAYRAAKPGQVIEIAAGTYPTQTVGVDSRKVNLNPPCTLAKPKNCVVFRPAAGGTVTVSKDLVMFGSNAIFLGSTKPYNFRLERNLISDAVPGTSTSHNVIFQNFDAAAFAIGPNHHITIKGGDWGPNYICDGTREIIENKIGPDGNIPNQWPHHIVLDGLRIHDQNSHDLGACHMGGLFLVSGHNLALRNSVFSRNVVYDVLVQDFSGNGCCGMVFGQFHNVVIENNWFGAPVKGLADPGGDSTNDQQPEIQFDERFGGWTNWLIRFNSFHNGLDFAAAGASSVPFNNVRVIGNIGTAPRCFAGAAGLTWAQNAWVRGRCSGSDASLRTLPYVNANIGRENFHLTGGRAKDLVTKKSKDYLLGTDIDGQKRPSGRARDAGADERPQRTARKKP